MAVKPVVVRFAVQSNPQELREFGDERLVNAHVETTGQGREAQQHERMSPGFTTFSSGADDIGCRGWIKSGDYIYAVFETGVYKIDSAGARTRIGAIAGTSPVTMALNNAVIPQIGVVNSYGRYYVIESDAISQIPTSDIGEFNSISYLGGYFALTKRTGEVYNTNLNDARVISGDYATAEGSPDGLVGGTAFKSELWLWGVETTEVFYNSGNAIGSPFSRLGGTWINKGAKSFHSVVLADNTQYWVTHDLTVCRNENGEAKRVSHEGVERAIANCADPSSIRGGTYTLHGHIYYVISAPEFTWTYDIKEKRWHERKSYNRNRWRADTFINAFDKWLCGTIDDGNIYEIDADSRTEGDQPIVTEMVSIDMGATPERFKVHRVEIDFVTGRAALSGTVPQTAPVAELSYTDDGGATWSNPRRLSLGTTGQYGKRVFATRLGRTGAKFGRRWKLSHSDPSIMAMRKFVMWVEGIAA